MLQPSVSCSGKWEVGRKTVGRRKDCGVGEGLYDPSLNVRLEEESFSGRSLLLEEDDSVLGFSDAGKMFIGENLRSTLTPTPQPKEF